jgi:hypothetical protein
MKVVGLFYDHLVYFSASWNILWLFDVFLVIWYIFPILVCCTKKNLAILRITILSPFSGPTYL